MVWVGDAASYINKKVDFKSLYTWLYLRFLLNSNEILHITNGIETPGNIVWSLLFGDVFVCIVMFLCLMKGIKSVRLHNFNLRPVQH